MSESRPGSKKLSGKATAGRAIFIWKPLLSDEYSQFLKCVCCHSFFITRLLLNFESLFDLFREKDLVSTANSVRDQLVDNIVRNEGN